MRLILFLSCRCSVIDRIPKRSRRCLKPLRHALPASRAKLFPPEAGGARKHYPREPMGGLACDQPELHFIWSTDVASCVRSFHDAKGRFPPLPPLNLQPQPLISTALYTLNDSAYPGFQVSLKRNSVLNANAFWNEDTSRIMYASGYLCRAFKERHDGAILYTRIHAQFLCHT